MLKLKLNEKLLETGKTHPQMWLRKHCGFGQKKAYNMIHGKAKYISIEDMSILCEKLTCTPNDLFYWLQSTRLRLPESHPCLTELKHPDKIGGWQNLLKKMTPKEAEMHYEDLVKKIEKK